jgi:hypothetical protein
MVTTTIAWLVGIFLVAVSASPARFERAFEAVTPSETDSVRGAGATSHSARPFVKTWRLLVLAVGSVCIALGVLGTVALAR